MTEVWPGIVGICVLAALVWLAVRLQALAPAAPTESLKEKIHQPPGAPKLAQKLAMQDARRYLWTGHRKYIMLGAIALLLWGSWIGRYEVVATQHNGSAVTFRLDRWTGGMEWCAIGRCGSIMPDHS